MKSTKACDKYSIPIIVCAIVALFAIVFVLTKYTGESVATLWTLGLFAGLAFLGWLLMACLVPVFEDEADQYEIGADAAGVFVFVPLGLSLVWVILLAMTIFSRMALRMKVFEDTLKWHSTAFGGVTLVGLLLVCIVPWTKSFCVSNYDY